MAVNDIVMGAAGASGLATYIEDVFSTYLYTGNGSTQTITNGIDLAGKGGLNWIKNRTTASTNHVLTDTVGEFLFSNLTNAKGTAYDSVVFNSTGFSVVDRVPAGGTCNVNTSANNYASWTFRKQPKFFDVVTYTGTGSATTIAHNLGSVPGCIIVKRTDTTGGWITYHRGLTSASYVVALNSTDAESLSTTFFNGTAPTSSVFSLGTSTSVNASGGTYVAYLFAHDAGGFGATGTDNVISCGSFTTDGSGNTALQNLGYEPQFLMTKVVSDVGNWLVRDNMRGFVSSTSGQRYLYPNLSNAESGAADGWQPTATGFEDVYASQGPNRTYIYIAIRRPMKTPTTGTSVYNAIARTGTGATGSSTSFGQVTDLVFTKQRSSTQTWAWTDRLRGKTLELTSAATTAETAYANDVTGFDTMTGFNFGTGASGQINTSATTYVDNLFKRAAGFFDIVCYVGGGNTNKANPHNLGVVPELIIVKERDINRNWGVYVSSIGRTKYLNLDDNGGAVSINGVWGTTNPTSTNFYTGVTGTNYLTNQGGYNYVAYLFATVAGVSKVGNYTGNGSSQTVNCSFTTGARFIMIKRTDSTGDWKVIDSARGIVAGNDPTLALNTTAAEVTGTDCIDPDSSGFIVNQETTNNLNVNAATYIFLAIA